jgi:acetoin utilization protein AcuB
MFVRTYMTPDPVFVAPDDNFPQAMSVIRKRKIRHLPVLEKGELVGIVVEKDLLSNQPSPATTLSLYEIYSLLETLLVRQLMSRPVITVEGDCPVEEAACIMVSHKISCLPVMNGARLVGIITETDVFRVLVEVLGGKETGTRLTLLLEERVGELSAITSRIAEAGGNIVAVTTTGLLDNGKREVTIKAVGANRDKIADLIKGSGAEIVDMRPTSNYQPRLFG